MSYYIKIMKTLEEIKLIGWVDGDNINLPKLAEIDVDYAISFTLKIAIELKKDASIELRKSYKDGSDKYEVIFKFNAKKVFSAQEKIIKFYK